MSLSTLKGRFRPFALCKCDSNRLDRNIFSFFDRFTLMCPITNTEPKKLWFVRSLYSGLAKTNVGHSNVFKDLHLCDPCLRINVNTFTKTEAFLYISVRKWSSVNGASNCTGLLINLDIVHHPNDINNIYKYDLVL